MNRSIPNPDSENALELAAIDLLVELGWTDWATVMNFFKHEQVS